MSAVVGSEKTTMDKMEGEKGTTTTTTTKTTTDTTVVVECEKAKHLLARQSSSGVLVQLPPKQLRMLVLCLLVASFLAALDQTIVGVALPAIAAAFKRLDLFSWVYSGYLLTASSAMPLYGSRYFQK